MSLFIGNQHERRAKQFLKQQGLAILKTNYRAQHGEIDLIAKDGETIVFVEVRYRAEDSHGSALESVTQRKQYLLMRTAECYLQQQGWTDRYPCRFDVIALSGLSPQEILWVKNAFEG